MSLELREMQRRFVAAVLGEDEASLALLAQDTAARLAVYRQTIHGGLYNVLAGAYPVTRRLVGDRLFTGLTERFTAAMPPQAPHLSSYGEALADFITRDDVIRHVPYLADVARLEWARHAAYFAADAAPLDLQPFATLPPEDMERTTVKLHPATRLLTSPFPLYQIWNVHQADDAAIPALDLTVGSYVLVSRRGQHVVTREITGADAALVAALDAGKTLGAAADVALAEDPAFDLLAVLTAHFVNQTFRN